VRNFTAHYTAVVDKVVGDDVTTVYLTDGISQAAGIRAAVDLSGNLIINADDAFTEWRRTGGGTLAPASALARILPANPVDVAARAVCSAEAGRFVVYQLTESSTVRGQPGGVVCGTDPAFVAAGERPTFVTRPLNK
jgi:hypothetical protein